MSGYGSTCHWHDEIPNGSVSARGLFIMFPRQGCLLRQLHLDFGKVEYMPTSKSRFLIFFSSFLWLLQPTLNHRLMERTSSALTGIAGATNVTRDEKRSIGLSILFLKSPLDGLKS